ncbi:MAG: hypothetical protein H0T90_09240 [Gemmatimonadales bacterium]|nr:hypothetical protein [Gemmatimonadales bacterium]
MAQQHFTDYAQAVMRLHNVIPAAVIRYLKEDGLPVREDVLPRVERTIEEAWSSHAQNEPRATETAAAKNL